MKKNYLKLAVFILLLIAGFGTAILILSWPLLTGETHILDVPRPVDPFDIFRGQYTTINYEINRIPNTEGLTDLNIGDYVYVSLEKDFLGISRPAGTSLTKPSEGSFIRGKIKSVSGNSVRVEYGIEQFFFERGASFSMVNITVEVKISNSGQARISKILQNGQPLEIEYREVSFVS